MKKKRVLFLITIQFSVRYLLRTNIIQKSMEFCEPIVMVNWTDKDLSDELKRLNIKVHHMPHPKYGRNYNRCRDYLNYWFKQTLQSPSTRIDEYRSRVISGSKKPIGNKALRNLKYIIVKIPGLIKFFKTSERFLVKYDTNYHEIDGLLRSLQLDAVFSITPYLREEQIILSWSRFNRKLLIASILSFDNITTRGYIPIRFDDYMVWNEFNKNELIRSYGIDEGSIRTTGPPQFDFYYNKKFIWSFEKWSGLLGLPLNRKVILFGAGLYSIVPNEPDWLKILDIAISDGSIKGNPVILLRIHPNDDLTRWEMILEQSENVVVDIPWTTHLEEIAKANVTISDIEKLCSTLYYSDVHINASSTMTIDGAIFDKPQIGCAFDESFNNTYDKVCKDLYLREHYLPITNSGGLTIVNSSKELVDSVNRYLEDPKLSLTGREKMIRRICGNVKNASEQVLQRLQYDLENSVDTKKSLYGFTKFI